VVLGAVSYLVYKKVCSKAAQRIPYHYDGVELMSFEI
jgi:hypothetical protein